MEEPQQKAEDKAIELALEEIRNDPYNYICNYAESLFPHTGGKVFKVLALVPPSLQIPDLPYENKSIRSNINVLFLAPSGAGKSSISKLFSTLACNPLEVESITSARLESEIRKNPKFSLIIGDFARMARDPIIIKVIEGILGEEKRVSRKTMKTDIETETNGVGLICGTPQDLTYYLSGGLLFRLVPKIILHNDREHSSIGSHIKDRIGIESNKGEIIEKAIQTYYAELEMIQEGDHEKIKAIEGYSIEQRFKERAYSEWNRITTPMVKETNMNFLRGLQEFFRFLVAHAFLNIYKRRVENGKLIPNDQDFDVAIKLMTQAIEIQYDILKTERYAQSLKNLSELEAVLNNPQVKQKYKDIIKNLVQVKNGKVSTNVR